MKTRSDAAPRGADASPLPATRGAAHSQPSPSVGGGQGGGGELTQHDLYLFNEGSHFRLYHKMGAHPRTIDGVKGTSFAAWAPGASGVSVMGDFNGWSKDKNPLSAQGSSGIWAG